MITTLTGPNSFMISSELKKLQEDFLAVYGGLALEKIRWAGSPSRAVVEATQSLPISLHPLKN